jgi:hypothetical protein
MPPPPCGDGVRRHVGEAGAFERELLPVARHGTAIHRPPGYFALPAARRLDVQSRELRLGLWAQPIEAQGARGWLLERSLAVLTV